MLCRGLEQMITMASSGLIVCIVWLLVRTTSFLLQRVRFIYDWGSSFWSFHNYMRESQKLYSWAMAQQRLRSETLLWVFCFIYRCWCNQNKDKQAKSVAVFHACSWADCKYKTTAPQPRQFLCAQRLVLLCNPVLPDLSRRKAMSFQVSQLRHNSPWLFQEWAEKLESHSDKDPLLNGNGKIWS